MIDLSKLDEKALEAAAKALNDLWCPTCQPYSDTGDAHIQYCQKSACAAITAYLATSTMTTQDLLREALEALDFYANKDNHKMRREPSYRDRFSQNMKPGRPKLGRVSEDKGKRARATADKIRAALREEQS